MVKEDNSFGVASVVLGIITLFISSLPGTILGIVGLGFGLKQKKIGKNKWSKAGIILNTIGIILGIVVFIYILLTVLKNPEFIAQIQGQFSNA